jgi:hypothetical protein
VHHLPGDELCNRHANDVFRPVNILNYALHLPALPRRTFLHPATAATPGAGEGRCSTNGNFPLKVFLPSRSEAVWAKPGNCDTSGKDAQYDVDDDIGRFVASAVSDGRTNHEEDKPDGRSGHEHGGDT